MQKPATIDQDVVVYALVSAVSGPGANKSETFWYD